MPPKSIHENICMISVMAVRRSFSFPTILGANLKALRCGLDLGTRPASPNYTLGSQSTTNSKYPHAYAGIT